MDLLYGLTGSLVLTVLYLTDRSKTMDLYCRLTGSLILTVLYFMNIVQRPREPDLSRSESLGLLVIKTTKRP